MSVNMTMTEEHVCLQISRADRQLIERAAGLAGQPVEEFVKSEALRSARQILRDDAVIHLTMRGWEQLEALFETEGPPNEALLRAAERNPMSDPWPLRVLPENPADLPARLASFDCGKATLNAFLRTTSVFNQQSGTSRTTYLHPPEDSDGLPRWRNCCSDHPVSLRNQLWNSSSSAAHSTSSSVEQAYGKRTQLRPEN